MPSKKKDTFGPVRTMAFSIVLVVLVGTLFVESVVNKPSNHQFSAQVGQSVGGRSTTRITKSMVVCMKEGPQGLECTLLNNESECTNGYFDGQQTIPQELTTFAQTRGYEHGDFGTVISDLEIDDQERYSVNKDTLLSLCSRIGNILSTQVEQREERELGYQYDNNAQYYHEGAPLLVDNGDRGFKPEPKEDWSEYKDEDAYGGSAHRYQFSFVDNYAFWKSDPRVRWVFSQIPTGLYEAYVTWSPSEYYAGDVTYTWHDGRFFLGATSVDMSKYPSSREMGGAMWHKLGRAEVVKGEHVFIDIRRKSKTLTADAVLLVPLTEVSDAQVPELVSDVRGICCVKSEKDSKQSKECVLTDMTLSQCAKEESYYVYEDVSAWQ